MFFIFKKTGFNNILNENKSAQRSKTAFKKKTQLQ